MQNIAGPGLEQLAQDLRGGPHPHAVADGPGSFGWFDCGFITYSNDAKGALLGVSPMTLARYGAVSEQTTAAMAKGTLERSEADISLSISGIAGPGGGSRDKPVGLVWFGLAGPDGVKGFSEVFAGDRGAVRQHTVNTALTQLLARVNASTLIA